MVPYLGQRQHAVLLTCIITVFFYSLPPASPQFAESYDFVIVGGGTAGCVLAARLSENGKHSVLLLEAGGMPHPDLDVPALSANYFGDLRYVRKYQSVPQANAGLTNNGIVELASGRLLGGGSSVNLMTWNRGSPYDFDNWATITNDSSWSYSNLLRFFKKSENYMGRFPSDQHGYSGPITVSRPNYAPLLQEWLEAGQHLGYPTGDPNGPQTVSYTSTEYNKRFGRRVSSYTGYLKPVLGRRNLRVVTGAEATQIILKGRKATGVRFSVKMKKSGGIYTKQVFARKEMILSAGAIESPALLLRSGIGPKQVLKSANIVQVAELPVGRNLQDHVAVNLGFVINNGSAVFSPARDLNPETLKIFNRTGGGPYSSYLGSTAQAFLKSSISNNGDKRWADILVFLISSGDGWELQSQPESSALLAEWEVPIRTVVTVARPTSRGRVILNPKNPSGVPLVDLQYFSDTCGQDMQVMIEAIKATLKTFEETPSFRNLGARYPPEPLSACKNLQFRSDAYWHCYVRELAGSAFHASGTCAMGQGSEDRRAVVDSTLRVIGVNNLRVIDASIMPVIVNANLQAVVIAIAEKAAELILKSWR